MAIIKRTTTAQAQTNAYLVINLARYVQTGQPIANPAIRTITFMNLLVERLVHKFISKIVQNKFTSQMF
jgi:hypothetical protein